MVDYRQMEYQLTIPIRSISKGRPRLGRRRKAHTPIKTVTFEKAIANAWQEAFPDLEPLVGPLGMRTVVMSNHVEVTIWELEESHRPKYITGDLDNYFKSVADGLNGIAFGDDKQLHHIESFLTKINPIESETPCVSSSSQPPSEQSASSESTPPPPMQPPTVAASTT